jgi:hypothetical protein
VAAGQPELRVRQRGSCGRRPRLHVPPPAEAHRAAARAAVVVEGRFALLLPEDEQIWAFTRTLGEQVLLVVANFSSSPATVPAGALPDVTGAQLLLSTHAGPASAELAPWESRIHLIG